MSVSPYTTDAEYGGVGSGYSLPGYKADLSESDLSAA